MGHIYRRGKNYSIKYYRNGKPYVESTHSDKLEVAKRLLKKREGEISEGRLPGICFDRVEFDELAGELVSDYEINCKKSLERVVLSIDHLKKVFQGMRVVNIDTPQIRGYIEKRQKKNASNATINRELAALKRMLNLGAKSTPAKVDKVPFIPMLKENNVRKGFFEHGDFLALRDALPEYLRGFVTFAYKVGWRKSEITNLKWEQVDLNQGIVRLEVGETKNDEARTAYLDEELREVFSCQRVLMKHQGIITPYVFPNWNGAGRISDFRSAWVTACKKIGIGTRLFHDFRRTAVRNMVRAGIPERVVMTISGHKTRAVFDRYNIVNDSDLRLAAKKQEDYLNVQNSYKTVTIGNFGAVENNGGMEETVRACQ